MSAAGGLPGRAAVASDAAAITRIYNQGIEEGTATFETRPRTEADVRAWLGLRFPVVVVEADGEVVAFASTSEYRPRECYAGIAEFSVYVDRARRGRRPGQIAHWQCARRFARGTRKPIAEGFVALGFARSSPLESLNEKGPPVGEPLKD